MESLDFYGKFCNDNKVIGSNYENKITNIEGKFKFSYISDKLEYTELDKKDIINLIRNLKNLNYFTDDLSIKNQAFDLILDINVNNRDYSLNFKQNFNLNSLENLLEFRLIYSIKYFTQILKEYKNSNKLFIVIQYNRPLLFTDLNKSFVLAGKEVE
jgi:hypothetical protein